MEGKQYVLNVDDGTENFEKNPFKGISANSTRGCENAGPYFYFPNVKSIDRSILLVNSDGARIIERDGVVSYILDISRHLFKILLSKYSSDCKDSKAYLEKKMDSEIESCKKLENDNIDSSGLISKVYETNIENDVDELPVREDVNLQQSKRSRYFKDCESFSIKMQEGFKHEHARTDDLNVFFSSTFAIYFLNNWCGFIPFWTSIHLGDQGRHGKSEPIKFRSEHFSDRACIKDPPRTQGIIEFHHKSLKHVTLNSKRDRLDGVVSNLLVAKISKHRQFEIAQSRKKTSSKTQEKMKESLPKKIAREKWSKRSKKNNLLVRFLPNKS